MTIEEKYKEKYKEKVEDACRWLILFYTQTLILNTLELTLLHINLKKKLLMVFVD